MVRYRARLEAMARKRIRLRLRQRREGGRAKRINGLSKIGRLRLLMYTGGQGQGTGCLSCSAILENPDLLTDGPASDIAIYCTLEAIDRTGTSIFKFLIYRIPSIQSDHLWMGFHSQIGFGESNQLNKCCCLRASSESPVPCMEVKKCRIRLVYNQNKTEYNLMARESSHPCDNLGLVNQVLDKPMVMDERSKLERRHHDSNMAGPSKSGSFDLKRSHSLNV
ncbi:hypothetical protein GH714_016059 [Hevea brasiliensis]|uniref:Uncharacterized protein n=1 Tax=Hevea brasiliensis TaxID=3981 RepID=A0A6A6KQT1_HEVBR|nr:hypothetical protein GH714_016059 [Hevea brasiliensis]